MYVLHTLKNAIKTILLACIKKNSQKNPQLFFGTSNQAIKEEFLIKYDGIFDDAANLKNSQ